MIKLVQHLLTLPPQEICLIAPQDMALCSLWHGVAADTGEAIEGIENFPRHLETWNLEAPGDRPLTEGRRHQTLLRELIELLQEARITSLARDELDFLKRTYELVSGTKNPEAFKRIQELLTGHIGTVESRIEILSPEPGLTALVERLQIVSSEDIQSAKRAETKTLSGVDLPGRGPVFRRKGQLRILGDVPENCTVIVEAGDCVVDGFVFGRVVATRSCEVRDNIAGVVIVRDGDIRARSIIDNATTISKGGGIFCCDTQAPRLMFAASHVEIKGSALQGNYVSPSIRIAGNAFGGQYHISHRVESSGFKCSDARPLAIVFRKRLSCRDYGEQPSKEMAIALSKAFRLRRKLSHGRRAIQLSAREAEEYASSALMYILGGEKIEENLAKTLAAQQRLNVLNRIVESMRLLYTTTREQLDEPANDGELEHKEMEEFSDSLTELMSDLPESQGNDSSDANLAERKAHVLRVNNDLSSGVQNRALVSKVLVEMEDDLRQWIEEANTLAEFIESNEKSLHHTVGWKNIKSLENDNVLKVHALRQIIKAAENRPKNDPAALRAQSQLVRLLLRKIRGRLNSAKNVREHLQNTQADFDQARAEVWNNFQIRVNEEESSESQRVSIAKGRYDSNTKIYAGVSFLESESVPEGRHVVTPNHGDEEVTYSCEEGVITEVR